MLAGMGVVQERSEDDEPEVRITGFGGLDVGDKEDLVFELADLSEATRQALRERLELLAVPHHWEGLSLVVSPDDEAWVSRIIEQVEDEAAVSLDPDADQIGYDLAEWDDQNREMLLAALEDETIAYGIDGDELIVHEIDEARVDELVDAIVAPDAPPSGAGEAPVELMGELFVAADRLVHDPEDDEGRLLLIAGAERALASGPPYGMDKAWWEATATQSDALVELLAAERPDFDAAIEAATALRDRLRPYV
jgi:hypothetical protein